MIEDGLFKKYPVDEIYGMHNMPTLKSGMLAVEEGPRLAAADNFMERLLKKVPTEQCHPILSIL